MSSTVPTATQTPADPATERGTVSALARVKLRAVRAMARAMGMRQIHIAGCARSGTNMAHVAMLAFEGVTISAQETAPDYPGLGALLRMYRCGEIGRGASTLVTKRGFNWSRPDQIDRLLRRLREEELGLLYLVRDPRDVLLSTHEATGRDSGYVSVERWRESMLAGERLLTGVAGRPATLVIRYEDLVLDPVAVQRRIGECFGLRLRPGIESIANLERTLEISGYLLPANRVRSMHRVRPFDAQSVGKWRRMAGPDHPIHRHPGLLDDYRALSTKYGYGD